MVCPAHSDPHHGAKCTSARSQQGARHPLSLSSKWGHGSGHIASVANAAPAGPCHAGLVTVHMGVQRARSSAHACPTMPPGWQRPPFSPFFPPHSAPPPTRAHTVHFPRAVAQRHPASLLPHGHSTGRRRRPLVCAAAAAARRRRYRKKTHSSSSTLTFVVVVFVDVKSRVGGGGQ